MRPLAVVLLVVGCGDSGGGAVDALVPDAAIDAALIDVLFHDAAPTDAAPGACDPVAQTCPQFQRCTLDHMLPTNQLFCESAPGNISEFGMCTPTQTSDDCVIHTVCLTQTSTTRLCRRFCNV